MKKPAPHTWRIVLLRGKAEHIATVEAPDEQAAIAKVIEEYDIPENRRGHLMAQRVNK